MPNHCENDLTVTGKRADVEAFAAFMKGTDLDGNETPFDFNRVLPYPEK
jgi:hypothetical protein